MTVTADTRHLVWIAPISWDGIPGTDRAMATEMTRYARVLWVDPPVSAVTPARLRGDIGGGILPSLSAAGDGITRLTPVALPGLSRPGVRATTAPLLRAQISWALRQLASGRPPSWPATWKTCWAGGMARSACCTSQTTMSPGPG